MHEHIAEAMSEPKLVHMDDGLVCLRFETMKVVSALGAVRHLLDTQVIQPGDILLDSSSGIYAYALALACHRYGLGCHIIGSTTIDESLRVQLAALGAHLEQMPSSTSLKYDQNRRVARIREILRGNPNYHWMQQYHDDIHFGGYRTVAEQISTELDTDAITVVGGVGSGASTGALTTFLRQGGTRVHLSGVQPFGSITFGSEHVPDPEIIIAGIGSSIPFGNVHYELYDTIHWLGFDAAAAGTIGLLRTHAVFAGLSTGAAYMAALWEREQGCSPHPILFIAADTGHRYVDTVFAKQQQTYAPEEFTPNEVSELNALAHPWSVMQWQGTAPPPAVANGL